MSAGTIKHDPGPLLVMEFYTIYTPCPCYMDTGYILRMIVSAITVYMVYCAAQPLMSHVLCGLTHAWGLQVNIHMNVVALILFHRIK